MLHNLPSLWPYQLQESLPVRVELFLIASLYCMSPYARLLQVKALCKESDKKSINGIEKGKELSYLQSKLMSKARYKHILDQRFRSPEEWRSEIPFNFKSGICRNSLNRIKNQFKFPVVILLEHYEWTSN